MNELDSLRPDLRKLIVNLGRRVEGTPPGPDNDARLRELLSIRGAAILDLAMPAELEMVGRELARIACIVITRGECTGACRRFVVQLAQDRRAA